MVSFKMCLCQLGFMASRIDVVPLDLLKMRDFQWWVAVLYLCCRRHLFRPVTVTASCLVAPSQWRDPALLSQGAPLRLVSQRKIIVSKPNLTGWWAVHGSRPLNGACTASENSTMVAYICHQGGTRSPRLHELAHSTM